jgi:phosphonate transport system substrate-binding protein
MKKTDRCRRAMFLSSAVMSLLCLAVSALAEGPVRIGIVPSQGAKELVVQYQPLMDYLAKKVGRPFELRPMKSYGETLEMIKSGEIEGGIMGSFVAEQSIHELGAIPVARPESKGVSTYKGFVIVRKDSGFKKIDDLKGKTFDYVSNNTSAGYLYPRYLLKSRKVDPEAFFSQTSFAGKHDIAVSKVLNKGVDGAAVKNTVLDKMAAADPRVKNELVVLHKSESFPDGTILFRKDSRPELVKAVKKALSGMKADAEAKAALASVGADRYIDTTLKDFAYVQKLSDALR